MSEKLQTSTRKEQAELTRRRLIDTARELFSENGYKGTSVRNINRRAELADGLLYHYFPGGKKELFGVIAAESFNRVIQEMKQLHGDYQCDDIPIEELLRKGFLNFTRIAEANLDVIRIIIKEKEVREIFNENEISRFAERAALYFENLLTRRIEKGEIRSIDCQNAALMINSLMTNYLFFRGTELACADSRLAEKYAELIRGQAALWKTASP